jgi:translation initiation factor 1A
MPPNTKGGKQYKKKAKGASEQGLIMIERQPGQQIARVIKILGNRFMSCYCNDSTVRVCRVRGKMRGREFVEKGDVVLISLRTFETGDDDDKTGDILAKYPHDSLSSLKKEEGINQKLFLQLELLDGSRLAELGAAAEAAGEFEGGGEDDSDHSDSSGTVANFQVLSLKKVVEEDEALDIDTI